jgi:hypothetical protein
VPPHEGRTQRGATRPESRIKRHRSPGDGPTRAARSAGTRLHRAEPSPPGCSVVSIDVSRACRCRNRSTRFDCSRDGPSSGLIVGGARRGFRYGAFGFVRRCLPRISLTSVVNESRRRKPNKQLKHLRERREIRSWGTVWCHSECSEQPRRNTSIKRVSTYPMPIRGHRLSVSAWSPPINWRKAALIVPLPFLAVVSTDRHGKISAPALNRCTSLTGREEPSEDECPLIRWQVHDLFKQCQARCATYGARFVKGVIREIVSA